MSNHAPLSDDGGESWAAVDHCPILNRRLGADLDGAVVAPQDGSRPDRRFSADGDIADDHRLWGDECIGVNRWGPVPESVDGHGGKTRPAGLWPSVSG